MQRVYTLDELAKFLNRPSKEIKKLAEKEILKGSKNRGEWIFTLPDVVLWMEHEMTNSEAELTKKLEQAATSAEEASNDILLTSLLDPQSIDLCFQAKTKASVINEIVKLGERVGKLWDPDTMADELRAREEMASTGMDNGVAILHPRRPQTDIIAENFLALGITSNPIPFGGGFQNKTDVFFLLCCQSDESYLRTLGKLARVLKTPNFLDELRQCSAPIDVLSLLQETEENL